MNRKIFSPKVANTTKGLYGFLAVLLIAAGIYPFITGEESYIILVLAGLGLLPLFFLYLAYKVRYEMTEDSLVCKMPFVKKRIQYTEIKEVKSYKLPSLGIRRFGLSLVAGRYSNKELGKFYAMFGGKRKGLLIITDSVYGGQIYIAPEELDKFLNELKKRTRSAVYTL